MSCVLRIAGESLVLEDLLKILPNPIVAFRKGDPGRKGKPIPKTGASYDVSEAEFDQFEEQKQDAMEYLKKHKKVLQDAMALSGVEGACLDFGVEDRDVTVQCDYLEPELLKLVGHLGLGIEISRYPESER